jgi:predicted lipoprotein with Yx(FWY)xxD motif
MRIITERPILSGGARTRGRSRRLFVLLSLGAIAWVTVGAAAMGTASAATPTVQVGTNATFGPILTTSSGMALYTLNTDHNGQSTCHGSCAAVWPPLNIPAGTVATGGPGVTGTVGAATQSNGTLQVTYNGSPLYTFVSDTAPGQVTGDGVTGFFVVVVSPTTTTTTAGAAPPSGTAPPTGTSATPAPAATSSGPAPSTASSGAPASAATSATPGALAFTGAGPGLMWLVVLGLLLLGLGALLAFIPIPEENVAPAGLD